MSGARAASPPGFDFETAGSAFMGDRRYWASYERNQVKGHFIATRARYVASKYGEDVSREIRSRLSPRARDAFDSPPIAFARVPYWPLLEIDHAMFVVAMGGQETLMRDFGAAVASQDLPRMFRALMKLGSPSFVLARTPLAYRAYLSPGTIAASVERRVADLELTGVVWPRYFCEHGISGWLRAAVALSGGTNVAVRHASCVHAGDRACTWRITWQE